MKIFRTMVSVTAVVAALILCACKCCTGETEKCPEKEKAVEAYQEFVRAGTHETLPPGYDERWKAVWMQDGGSLLLLTNNADNERWQGVHVYTFDNESGQVHFLGEYGSRGRLWVNTEDQGTVRARYGKLGGYDVILRLEAGRLRPVRMLAVNAGHERPVFYEAAIPSGYFGSTPEEEDFYFDVIGNRISEKAYDAKIRGYMGNTPIEVDYSVMRSKEEFLSE